MESSKAVALLLTVALAIQPAWAGICVCQALSSRDSQGPAAKERPCCGGANEHRCCCGGGGECRCAAKARQQVPTPGRTTPSPRVSVDESLMWTACVEGLAAKAPRISLLASEACLTPICFATPPERCGALCRWLL